MSPPDPFASLADPSAADADPEAVARAIVLRTLTGAPRTRAQLADDLRRRNVPGEVSERVLDRFTDVGLIDDAAFADAWVRSRHASRGLAARALRHELRERGVADDTIDEALGEVGRDEERAAATALVSRKLESTRGLPADRRMRRLLAMLARKGYAQSVAAAVVREALRAEQAGAS